jgi:hypothetical protein
MTATRQVTLWCEGRDTPAAACYQFLQVDTADVREARRIARREYGWRYRGGSDYCRTHADAAVRTPSVDEVARRQVWGT